jgi:hypothetical protein
LMNTRDREGKYVTRLIIEHAERYPHGGWLGYSFRNAYAMVYVEKVSVPEGDFVIGATYYPDEKYIQVRFMVDRAILYLKNNPKEIAFNMFASDSNDFLRGDTKIFVVDKRGIVLVDGQDRSNIWQNIHEDTKNATLIEKVRAVASTGGGWIEIQQNNATRKIYVGLAQKPTGKKGELETYVIGSSYYL